MPSAEDQGAKTASPVKTVDPVQARLAVQNLAPYRPGKGAKQAEQEHGITDAIKLASNENPYAPVPAVVDAIQAAASGINRYGDHGATELRSALSEMLGVEQQHVTVGCGSVGLLQQLCLAFLDPDDEVIFPWLSFEAYPVFVKMMGAIPVSPPLVDDAFDMEAVAAAVGPRTKMVFLATPNNPTGTAISTTDVQTLLDLIPNNIVVVVDEAYREFADDALGDPVVDLHPRHKNLVVTRTLSKAYGLAGVRVGYGVADESIVNEIDKLLIPFAVNNLAQAAALAALRAMPEIQKNIDQILSERDRVVEKLRSGGWKLPDPQANFVYLAVGEDTDRISLELEQNGVVVRPFSNEGIRVTIGSQAENDRFLDCLSNIASPYSHRRLWASVPMPLGPSANTIWLEIRP